jgi:hypothetical protein
MAADRGWVLRSGWLLGLDADAAHLAALGLMRVVAQERSAGAGAGPAWLWHERAVSFADTWLAVAGSSAPGLRVPVGAVLRALAYRAADLVLEAHRGDGPAALAWMGRQSAEACAREPRTAHPADPVALAMVWHGVRALTPDGEDAEAHDRRMSARCDAYIREKHPRQDSLALLVACARIAATALHRLSGGQPGTAREHLDELATNFMFPGHPVPPWVPCDPAQFTG